tara:strand:- start:661 stop:1518 length:858 start_codon:yes stop_codon:yes gene_type:complete
MEIPKIIFIIPYRDREPQKIHFTIYINYILEDLPKNSYEIYFCHQNDNRKFNRGAIKNIGFIAMKEKYPDDYKNITFVFNDIDTIPNVKNIINYETTLKTIKHFYGFRFALGGFFSIKGEDFEICNGFPNFWGWGLEDNIMQKRVLDNNMTINRSNFFPIGDINIHHSTDSPIRLINDRETSSQLTSTEGIKDINKLIYNIKNSIINVTYFETLFPINENEFYNKNLSTHGRRSNINVLKKWNNINQNNINQNNINQNNINQNNINKSIELNVNKKNNINRWKMY